MDKESGRFGEGHSGDSHKIFCWKKVDFFLVDKISILSTPSSIIQFLLHHFYFLP